MNSTLFKRLLDNNSPTLKILLNNKPLEAAKHPEMPQNTPKCASLLALCRKMSPKRQHLPERFATTESQRHRRSSKRNLVPLRSLLICAAHTVAQRRREQICSPKKHPFSDQIWTRVVFDNINNSSGWPTFNNAKDSREHYANIKTQSQR